MDLTESGMKVDFFAEHYFSCWGSNPDDKNIYHNAPTYYGIQYNHSGRFFLSVNHGKQVFEEGPCVFITHPGAYFEYGCLDQKPRHHNWICSYGDRIEKYISSGLMVLSSEPSIIKIRNPEKFLQTMLGIISLIEQPVMPQRAILLYEDLLLQIYESQQKIKSLPPFQETILKNLISEIRNHPERDFDFAEAAEQCHVTLAHFRRLFRILTNMPPNQFQIHCKLQRAAFLLLTTHDSIGNIAEAVGIGSPFYFSLLFKKKYFIPPLEYRREFKGIQKD